MIMVQVIWQHGHSQDARCLFRTNRLSAKAICGKQRLEADQLGELGTAKGKEGSALGIAKGKEGSALGNAKGKEGSKRQSQTSTAKSQMSELKERNRSRKKAARADCGQMQNPFWQERFESYRHGQSMCIPDAGKQHSQGQGRS